MSTCAIRRIGILTGGGDCPGLNAVIRAVAKPAIHKHGAEVIGIEDGFEGMVEGRMHELRNPDVSGILNLGGTILGTSNKGDPWHYPVMRGKRLVITNAAEKAIANYRKWKLDALVAVGGEGTMTICSKLMGHGLNVVGVPKTIDNDLNATDVTFGYDTAVQVATQAIDSLHTTASSHHRVMVIEVMGRHTGWIALGAGVAGGADIILLPEIPFEWERVFAKVQARSKVGKRFSILCAAEGARCPGRGQVVQSYDRRRTDAKQLGGIGNVVAAEITRGTGLEARVTVLGHLQRGGSPTAYDRLLATRFGSAACERVARREFGRMVALRGQDVVAVPITEAVASLKTVPPDHPLISAARAVGTSFGDY